MTLDYALDEETGCWVWLGERTRNGYGLARIGRDQRASGGPRRRRVAHRVLYEQRVGPVPEGMVLDHLCRNRLCVNPEHLEPVTVTENVRRSRATKMTPAEVREIRASSAPLAVLAARYGMAKSTLCQIRKRQVWKDVA